jgi:rhamnosyltransferase subunit B
MGNQLMRTFRQDTPRMKAIICAAGSDGDIHPHLGVSRELLLRGHHVVFITSLNYIDMARDCGFEAVTCLGQEEKEDFEQTEGLSSLAKIRARCRFFSENVAKVCEVVAGRLDDRSILIAPPFAYTMAKLLHIKYGTPYVSTALAPSNILCSLKNPPHFKWTQWFSRIPYVFRKPLFRGAEGLVIDPLFRKLLKDSARMLDFPLPEPRRVISEWLYSSQKILGLFPDLFSPRPEDWPAHITVTVFPLFHPSSAEQQLSPGLSQFLDAGPPPVVFTASTDTQKPRAFFEIMLKAAQVLGVRGIFLTRLSDQLPKLPGTIWHESYTSLKQLLRRASVLVHHGGIGTTAQALRAAIPQLIVPVRMDQLDNGRHIQRLGCGLVHQDSLAGHTVIQKLKYLLSAPQVHDICRSTQIRMEPGEKACFRAADVIEETSRNASKVIELAELQVRWSKNALL